MSVTRVGATKQYSDNWDNIFGGKRRTSKAKASATSTRKSAKKKSPRPGRKKSAKKAGKPRR